MTTKKPSPTLPEANKGQPAMLLSALAGLYKPADCLEVDVLREGRGR